MAAKLDAFGFHHIGCRRRCISALHYVYLVALILALPSAGAFAQPVFDVPFGHAVNVVDAGIVSGPEPLVIIDTALVSGAATRVESVGELCVRVSYGAGGSPEATIDVTVRNLHGEQTVRFTARGTEESISEDCDSMGQPPTADAGGPYTVEIPPGESEVAVQLDGSGSTDDNAPLESWQWQIESGDVVAESATTRGDATARATAPATASEIPSPSIPLSEGTYRATLTVRDRDGQLVGPNSEPVDSQKTDSDTAQITVVAATEPPPSDALVANAGPDQTLTDTDGDGVESVQLDGSQSSGTGSLSYSWSEGGEEIATGAQPEVSLSVGTHTIVLTVLNLENEADEDTVVVNVDDGERDLSSLPQLTPAQESVATHIDGLCPRLTEYAAVEDPTASQQQLLARCSGLVSPDTTDAQAAAALEAINGDEIATQQTNALDFSNVQLSNVGNRIVALRGGSGGGVSVAGLNLRHDGQRIPLAQLADLAAHMLTGGAASGDAREEPGGLLSERFGIFVNGNLATGDKDRTANEVGFDFDGWGITAGVDYRFTNSFVLGAGLGYNESETKFDGGGRNDGDSVSASVYGTYFSDNLYFDFIGNFGSVDYDSLRRIEYTDAEGTHNFTAKGQTDGDLTSLGLSVGYDFHIGGATLGPTLSLNRREVELDPFAESGASGLNLAFAGQEAKSQTAEGGFRFSYALSRPWGILSPHARVSFVEEMENESQVLIAHFVNDPFVNDPDQPSPGFTMVTDDPDENYLRWGVGVSAAFLYGMSAFIDYESYSGFRHVDSHELSFGFRIQRSFR